MILENCLEVNNFEKIYSLLKFNSPEDFYLLEVMSRRKDNPELEKTRGIVKVYYIDSIDLLQSKEEEIKKLCKLFNARAYINLSVKNYERVAFKMIKKVSDCICENQYKVLTKAYQSECDKSKSDNPIWVIDVDVEDEVLLNKLITEIESCQSEYSIPTIDIIPTLNGYHVLTHPFNVKELEPFLATSNGIEVKKDRPTLLYYSN